MATTAPSGSICQPGSFSHSGSLATMVPAAPRRRYSVGGLPSLAMRKACKRSPSASTAAKRSGAWMSRSRISAMVSSSTEVTASSTGTPRWMRASDSRNSNSESVAPRRSAYSASGSHDSMVRRTAP